MKSLVLEYITGFYEGEGCCAFYKYDSIKSKGRLTVRISQNERYILDWISHVFNAGSVHWVNGSNCYYLDFGTSASRKFLYHVLPRMKVRKKILQAKKALRLDKKHIKKPRGFKQWV